MCKIRLIQYLEICQRINVLFIIKAFVFIQLFTLAGCQLLSNTKYIDKSFITGEPCAPPCWYGLEINKSTKEDVIAQLDQLPFVDKGRGYHESSTVWNDAPVQIISFYCHFYSKRCGSFIFSENELEEFWIVIQYNLSFQEAVEHLGEPDFLVYATRLQGGCDIFIDWSNLGITISGIDTNKACQNIKNGGGVSPHNLVETITYLSKNVLSDEPGGCCTRIPWPGFTNQE